MNELSTTNEDNIIITHGQYAVIDEATGYRVIDRHRQLIIADKIDTIEEAKKTLYYLNQNSVSSPESEKDRGDNFGSEIDSIDKLPVKPDVKRAIRNYAPATTRVETQNSDRGFKYKCYDAAGNYLGQVRDNFGS